MKRRNIFSFAAPFLAYVTAFVVFIFLMFAAIGLERKICAAIAFVIYAVISALLGLRMNPKSGTIGIAAYAVMLGVFPLFSLNDTAAEISPAAYGNIFYSFIDGIKPTVLRYLLCVVIPLIPLIVGMIIGVKKKGNGIDNSEEKTLNKKSSAFQNPVFCIAIPFILELITSVFYFLIAFERSGLFNEAVLTVILYAVFAIALGYFMDLKWGLIGLAVYAVPLIACPFIYYDESTPVLRFFAQNGNVFYSMILSDITSDALRHVVSVLAALVPFAVGIIIGKLISKKAKNSHLVRDIFH